MSTNYISLQYRHFVVDERAICLWDFDIQRQTVGFLESIDPTYFEYMARTHSQSIGDGDEAKSTGSQHAALALRTTYSQALETLFAFIGAAVQAPFCVPAWINAYQNKELRSIVDKIQNHKPLLSLLIAQPLTWSSISEIIFANMVLEDKDKEKAIKAGFAQLWSRFASEFLSEDFDKEYNSIKHGLRIRPGGFQLAIGAEDRPGVAASQDRMRLLGKSQFGSSYLANDKIGELSYHIRLKRHRRNWDPEDIVGGITLATWSISNVLSALRVMNGVAAEQVQFNWPRDPSLFQEPWKRSIQIGVTGMTGLDTIIQPEFINPYSKETIRAEYEAGKDAGTRRIVLNNPQADNDGETHSRDEKGVK